MKKIEILAPAGNLDSLLAGIHSGADAVYFGYGELNARRNAKTLTSSPLPRHPPVQGARRQDAYDSQHQV